MNSDIASKQSNARTGRPKQAGRPTKAQAEARTEALLDTACDVFCRKGFAGASLDEIAEIVGSSKHTIYRRFSSKFALLEAVVERDVEQFRRSLGRARADAVNPVEALHAMARTYFDFGASRDYSALYSAIALEAATSEQLRSRVRRWARDTLAPLEQAISEAAPTCGWYLNDTTSACELLVDLLDGAAARVRLTDAPVPDVRAREGIFEERWAVFCRTMDAEAGPRKATIPQSGNAKT